MDDFGVYNKILTYARYYGLIGKKSFIYPL